MLLHGDEGDFLQKDPTIPWTRINREVFTSFANCHNTAAASSHPSVLRPETKTEDFDRYVRNVSLYYW
jgi:hypothetical protein